GTIGPRHAADALGVRVLARHSHPRSEISPANAVRVAAVNARLISRADQPPTTPLPLGEVWDSTTSLTRARKPSNRTRRRSPRRSTASRPRGSATRCSTAPPTSRRRSRRTRSTPRSTTSATRPTVTSATSNRILEGPLPRTPREGPFRVPEKTPIACSRSAESRGSRRDTPGLISAVYPWQNREVPHSGAQNQITALAVHERRMAHRLGPRAEEQHPTDHREHIPACGADR